MVRNVSDGREGTILLGLLEAVASDGTRSQRGLASELGIAVGLVNAYLRRCVKKGLVKVHEAPARRYAYYLTPRGFAEKSRLTIQYLSYSFEFFRQARSECAEVLREARAAFGPRIVLVGLSDVTEVAVLCALETDVEIVAIISDTPGADRCAGISITRSFEGLHAPFDAVIITAPRGSTSGSNLEGALAAAVERAGGDRVFAPRFLGIGTLPSRSSRP